MANIRETDRETVFYVGATSALEANWRWDQNVKRGTSFISSHEEGWVQDECARINAENLGMNPESAGVLRPLRTYKITIKIEEMEEMGKHSSPGNEDAAVAAGQQFDASWDYSQQQAAGKPQPTLQEQQATASAARADLAKADGEA